MPPGACYSVLNGPAPTTAAQAPVATGTAIKTMLQLESVAPIEILGWYFDCDASALATPLKVELCHTDVPATVTAFAAADVTLLRTIDGVSPTSKVALGTALSGYTASAEGTVASVVEIEAHLVEPIGAAVYVQYPRGDEPVVPIGRFLRIRVTAGTGVNAYCGVKWREFVSPV